MKKLHLHQQLYHLMLICLVSRLPGDGLLPVVHLPFACALSNFGFQVLYVLEGNELAKLVLNHFFHALVVLTEV